MNTVAVQPREWICFHCRLCGLCCKNVKDSVMLEPLDIYRLSRFLRDRGERIDGTEDVLARYAHPGWLTEYFPIFLLDTEGPEDACVFLRDGRCSIYEARPRTCRLYPFTVAPGSRGRDFQYDLCLEKPHHFDGGRIQVRDWLYQNFSREDRDFVKADYDAVAALGQNIRAMGEERFQEMLFPFLYYRYYNYDLDRPFLPQFISNQKTLLRLTREHMEGEGPS